LVERDFTAGAPNQVWLADITEHWTVEGKLYLCAIKDVYSNRIVGYSIDSRMKSRLLLHSTTSSPGVSLRVPRWLAVCSTATAGRSFGPGSSSRRASPHHGRIDRPGRRRQRQRRLGVLLLVAAKDVLDRRSWTTREELRIAIVTWIERPTTVGGDNPPSAG